MIGKERRARGQCFLGVTIVFALSNAIASIVTFVMWYFALVATDSRRTTGNSTHVIRGSFHASGITHGSPTTSLASSSFDGVVLSSFEHQDWHDRDRCKNIARTVQVLSANTHIRDLGTQ